MVKRIDYLDYTLTDFLKDEYFVQWVKGTDEETNLFWESWMQNYPVKRKLVMQAREVVEQIRFNDLSAYEPTSNEYKEVFSKILKKEKSISPKVAVSKNRQFWNMQMYRKIAAIFMLAVAGSGAFYYWQSLYDTPPTLAVKDVIKQNPKGQRSIFTLTDGTVVHLNANSRLVIPENFSKSNRQVALEGEAFFDVVKNHQSPFIILCDDVKTTVLGTSFNIYAYPDKDNFKVALVTGKLVVELKDTDNDSIELKPNEMVRYNKNTGTINKMPFTNTDFMAWKDGVLKFKEADIDEIAERLEQWYGVTIMLEGKVGIKRKFSGKFDNKSLEYVLDGMSYTSGFEYKIQGKEVIIKNLK